MRDAAHPVSLALDTAPMPLRDVLPISEPLAYAILRGDLEPPWGWHPDDVPTDFAPPFEIPAGVEMFRRADTPTVVDWTNDREPVIEYKRRIVAQGEAFQRLHVAYPQLGRAVIEPCADPGCAGPPAWGAWCAQCRMVDTNLGALCARCGSGHIVPRRALWDVIRHLRRDHDWPRARIVARLGRRPR